MYVAVNCSGVSEFVCVSYVGCGCLIALPLISFVLCVQEASGW